MELEEWHWDFASSLDGMFSGAHRLVHISAVAGNSPRALKQCDNARCNVYDMQAIGSSWTATVGTQYKVSVDIKASVANAGCDW